MSNPLLDQKLNPGKIPEDSNFRRAIAESRNVQELNHGHTSAFSDGSDVVPYRVREAVRSGAKRLAFTDHGDATGISGRIDSPGYYGEEEFHVPDSLKEAIDEVAREEHDEYLSHAESFDIELAAGMEIDYDPDNLDQLEHYIHENLEDGPLDMMIMAVHYKPPSPHDNQGLNVGYSKDFRDTDDPEEVLEEYFQVLIPGAARLADKFPGVTTLAHWDRPEGNPFLADHVTAEMYEDALKEVEKYDVKLEYNAKTNLRNLLNHGHPTIGSRVLINQAEEFTGGTDTHRVGKSGKVDYKVDETEARFNELERVAEETGKMVPVLEGLDLQKVRLPVENVVSNHQDFSDPEAEITRSEVESLF